MVQVLARSTFGAVVLVILFLCIWVAIAFWPARVARRKGHSFLGYFTSA
jgi:cbb3-type cytochrome oxidase subunit 3